MWRLHWDCWWYHCPWLYGSWTWCPPMEAHGSCLEVWFSIQPQENTSQGTNGEILWMPLSWIWSPPRSRESSCCTHPAYTNQYHRTSRVPWHGNIPQLFHSWSFHPDCSPAWATQERCRIQLGCLLSNNFSMSWGAVVSDTTLWYFDASCPIKVQVDASQVRLGAALLQDNKPVAFASKATYWSWMWLFQHWVWDVCCCLQCWMVQDLCLW